MNMTLKRIDVVVLFVADLQRAKAFYRDTLSMKMKFEDEASAGFDFDSTLLLLLSIAGAQDLLSKEAVAVQRPTGSSSQLVSFVENVDTIYADLLARGVEFVTEPIDREWGLRTAHFKDPDGNIWEIAHSLAKS
jgi:catechol 2,3-dioxygenase-like lactoylglutathione lyase family enzyme